MPHAEQNHEVPAKPRTCPHCGRELRLILYGMPPGPPPEGVLLGGCIFDGDSPTHGCPVCDDPSVWRFDPAPDPETP